MSRLFHQCRVRHSYLPHSWLVILYIHWRLMSSYDLRVKILLLLSCAFLLDVVCYVLTVSQSLVWCIDGFETYVRLLVLFWKNSFEILNVIFWTLYFCYLVWCILRDLCRDSRGPICHITSRVYFGSWQFYCQYS